MKKFIALLLVLSIFALALVSCADKPVETEETTETVEKEIPEEPEQPTATEEFVQSTRETTPILR